MADEVQSAHVSILFPKFNDTLPAAGPLLRSSRNRNEAGTSQPDRPFYILSAGASYLWASLCSLEKKP